MEAIAELFVAMFVGLIEIALLPLQIALRFVGLGLEFLLTTLFHGRAAANEKLQQRQAAMALATASAAPMSGTVIGPDLTKRRTILAVLVIVGLLGTVGCLWIHSKIRQHRIDSTKLQIARLADDFMQQALQPNANLPEGVLPDHDAWGHGCELFVDQWAIGTLIVVRSAGPDCKTGTIDDMLAVRFDRQDLPVLGKELAAVILQAVRNRLPQILPAKQGNPLPPQIDFKVQ